MTGGQPDEQTSNEFVIEEVTHPNEPWGVLEDMFLRLHRHHEPWQSRQLRDDWQGRWRDFAQAGPDSLILVAYRGDEPVGYLTAQIRRDYGLFDELVGFLNEIFVLPDHRGTGIGSALLQRCEDWCKTGGATHLDLTVLTGNRAGVDFWTHSGFSAVSYRMSKPLEVSQ